MSPESTLNERFRKAITEFREVSLCHDSVNSQEKFSSLLKEFSMIKGITTSLDLYSDNEYLEEMNPSYIPFLAIDYYIGAIYTMLHANPLEKDHALKANDILIRLRRAQEFLLKFLETMSILRSILSTEQQEKWMAMKANGVEATSYSMASSNVSMTKRRDEKIRAFKRRKTLEEKVYGSNLHEVLSKGGPASVGDDERKELYIDELRLLVLNTFDYLETIYMEIRILDESLKNPYIERSTRKQGKPIDRTLRVDELPGSHKSITELVGKKGEVLRPFIITKTRSDHKRHVFGNGQTLPSMSVDEYLEYELSHGKLLKPEEVQDESESEGTEDELETRRWDDWKDDNPKGSGNMKGNIG